MRVFGKVAWGLSAMAGLYFCIDMFMMRTNHSSARATVTEEQTAPQAQTPPLQERLSGPAPQPTPVVPPAPVAEQRPAEPPQTNRAAELAATLEGQYSVDAPPTREAADRERALAALFRLPELDGKGILQELDCRETICRGVVKVASEQTDSEVFGRTLLSPSFATTIHDAVTVASRQKAPDGSVVATFFVHPQSVYALLGP
jgi:hypothetical protein